MRACCAYAGSAVGWRFVGVRGLAGIEDYRLSGKRALVCGSTQGIGRACAMQFAQLGAAVTLLARSEEALKRVKAELAVGEGQTHAYVVADFNNPSQVAARVAEHLNTSGPV